jgi:hypothetical protein
MKDRSVEICINSFLMFCRLSGIRHGMKYGNSGSETEHCAKHYFRAIESRKVII